LEPEYAKAAGLLKAKNCEMRLAKVDATVQADVAQRFNIRGYPTLKYFSFGAEDSPLDYDGGRTSSDIVTWALAKVAENAAAPEIRELLEQDNLESECDNRQLCVLSFFPSLFDCQSKCRNEYINLLKKLADKFKRHQWGWLWTESAKIPNLEQALSVGGFGYPALVAVNSRKGIYVLFKGSFSEEKIGEFLRELSYGRGSTLQLANNKLPQIENVSEWDGRDAILDVEEDIDLSDVSLDDMDDVVPIRKKAGEL
jgi:protein disulfide-isomerase A6